MRNWVFALILLCTPAMAQIPPENTGLSSLAGATRIGQKLRLCDVEALGLITFTTPGEFDAHSMTSMMYGKRTFSVATRSNFWVTDAFIFSFEKSGLKGMHHDVIVQTQQNPKRVWKGSCQDLKRVF